MHYVGLQSLTIIMPSNHISINIRNFDQKKINDIYHHQFSPVTETFNTTKYLNLYVVKGLEILPSHETTCQHPFQYN